jgi:hypothetical protein
VAVPYGGVFAALAFWIDTPGMWWVSGFAVGLMLAVGTVLWILPPEHVLRWGTGAVGERATADAIRPLLKEGWEVWHDIPDGRGNIDHLLAGPAGVFLLETKFPSGQAAVEDGVLTVRYPDDPEEIFRNAGLRNRVLAGPRRYTSQSRQRPAHGSGYRRSSFSGASSRSASMRTTSSCTCRDPNCSPG